MKWQQKEEAQQLRKKGASLQEIAKRVGVSKASVSVWVRDIELSVSQRRMLSKRGRSVESIERRRKARIANTLARHKVVTDLAKDDIPSLTRHELLLVGAALYWGEGGKTKKGMARIANSDPRIICLMVRFFIEICGVPPKKFRGHVHTFSHLNARKAEEYWSHISGIPLKQFYKTYAKPSSAGKGHKDSTPFGTFQIYVCDTQVFLRVMGWIEKLAELTMRTSA
jgi:hypothetical protein